MLPVLLTDTVTSDLERALHYTLLWGLQGVELRTVGGVDERVPHVNQTQVKQRLASDEMLPAAIDPSMFEGPVSQRVAWLNELAGFDETLRFCERLACPRIVVSPFAREAQADLGAAADALRQAGEAASTYGHTIAVLNGADTARPTGQALAALLDAVDHPFVQAAWSPAAALQVGEDPAEGLAALGDRVTLVRCRDGRQTAEGWMELPFGEGAIDWPAQLRQLNESGFSGPLSLEVRVEPKPKWGLRSATALIRLVRAVRTAA